MTTLYEYTRDLSEFMDFDKFKNGMDKFVIVNFLFRGVYSFNGHIKRSYSFLNEPCDLNKIIRDFEGYKIILFYTAWATDNMNDDPHFIPLNIYENEHYHVLKFNDSNEMHEYLKNK